MVRVVFYIVGADFLRGTWVQQTWMALALLTVFMGSMLAYPRCQEQAAFHHRMHRHMEHGPRKPMRAFC